MSKAVYAKLWMATSQYHLRRHFGWFHVWKRVAPWGAIYGAFGVWLVFPALTNETRQLLTLGLWKPTDLHSYRSTPLPYE